MHDIGLEIKIQHWNWILRTKLPLNEVLHLALAQAVRVSKNFYIDPRPSCIYAN